MIVTGSSNSRLSELRKYAVTTVFADQYTSGGNIISDGVDYGNSVSGETMTYYLGGIEFIDDITGGTTTFTFTPSTFTDTPLTFTGVTTPYPTYTATTTQYSIGNDPTVYDATPLTYTGTTYYTGTTIYTGATIVTTDNNDFVSVPYYKHPDKGKIISQPKINDDVFIIRDEQSALDKNYKLEYITNLVELTTYAGGRFFNIINNT